MQVGLSSCEFAKKWARSQGGSHVVALTGVEKIPAALRRLAKGVHVPTILVFPGIRTERQLYDFAKDVGKLAGWTHACRVGTVGTQKIVDITLQLQTAHGVVCPIGLAPSLAMPPTRRAPFAGMAIWLFGRENMLRTSAPPVLSLGDCSPSPDPLKTMSEDGLRDAKRDYRATVDVIRARASALLEGETYEALRSVTFRVSLDALSFCERMKI